MKTHLHLRSLRHTATLILAGSIAALPALHSAQAASQTWTDAGANRTWSTVLNWSGEVAPGLTVGTTNSDIATFNAASPTLNPVVIDLGRNIGGISFATAASSYVVGSTNGNPLLLSSGGTIQILSTHTYYGPEVINAPLVIEGANGTYTFANYSLTDTIVRLNTLKFGGGITGGAVGNTVLTLSGTNANANTISGIIANGTASSLAVTLSGTGMWTLSGANTFTGGLTLGSSNTLNIHNASALGSGPFVINGGTIGNTSRAAITTGNNPITINESFTFAGPYDLNLGTGPITLGTSSGTTRSIAVTGGTLTIRGSIANGTTANSIALSRGTLVLSGANTYSGTTTVGGGELRITGNSAGATGAATVTSGALRVSDASGVFGSTAYAVTAGVFLVDNTSGNNNSRIADTATISLGRGSFLYYGASAAATNSAETVGTINAGAFNSNAFFTAKPTVTVRFGSTNSATLRAASVTHAAGEPSILTNGVNLGKDAGSTTSVARFISTSAPTLVGANSATATGINAASKNTQIVPFLVGEATRTTGGLGTEAGRANTFVTYNSTTGFRPLNPADEFTNDAIVAGNNTRIVFATTAGATTAVNSLLMDGSSLTIADGQTLTDTSGAILFTGSYAIKPSSSTGALIFGAGAEGMVTTTSSIDGTISAVIADNGGTALTKSGPGTLILTGKNTYTGKTTISVGALSINSIGNVNGGASSLGNPSDVAAGTIDLADVLIYTGGGSSSDRVINLKSQSSIQNTGSGTLTLTGGITGNQPLFLSSYDVNSLGGNQDITVTGMIDGVTQMGYSGVGTLTLTNPNNSFGSIAFSDTVSISSIANAGVASAFGRGSLFNLGSASSNASGKLQFTGANGGTSDRSIIVTSANSFPNTNGGIIENTVAGQTLNLSGSVTVGNFAQGLTPSLQLIGAGDGVLSGTISNRIGNLTLTKSGTGTWTLSGANSYTGKTTMSAGTLRVNSINNGGSSGNLGAASDAAENLVFDGGALQYTGATASTDRNFTINAGKTATFDITTNNLTVSGTSIATTGALTKTGAGILTLSGANLHSGDTTVHAGILKLSGSGSLANSANLIVGDAGSTGTHLDVTTKTGGLTLGLGRTLQGIGQIDGNTTILGTHAPGNSPGLQTFNGNLAYSTGSMLNWELAANKSTDTTGLRGTDFDAVNMIGVGVLTIGTGVTSNLIFNGAGSAVDWTDAFWDGNHRWLAYSDANLSSLASLSIFDTIALSTDSLGATLSDGTFAWEEIGNDVFLDFTAAPVPEPGIFGLLLVGVPLLGLRRRRG